MGGGANASVGSEGDFRISEVPDAGRIGERGGTAFFFTNLPKGRVMKMNETNLPEEKKPDGDGEVFTKEQVDALLTEQKAVFERKLAETEQLSAMDEGEKEQFLREKLRKELDTREAALVKRELRAAAVEKLGERKLPASLLPCINLSSEESLEESLNAVSECFSKTLREEVGLRVHLGAPKGAASGGSDAFLEGLGVQQ